MKKPSPDAAQAEIEELSGFLGFYFDHYIASGSVSADLHPLGLLKKMQAEVPPSVVRKGLRMAINDCIEMSLRWTSQQVSEADNALRSNGLVTLSDLRRRFSRQFTAVLNRGKIASEVEYYVVRGILADGCAPAEQRVLLASMADNFETDFVRKEKRRRARRDPSS